MATILVVEDRQQDRQYLVEILTYAGYRVLEADEAGDILPAVRAGNPGLVILDALAPSMEGLELIRQIRAESRTGTASILAYTATHDEEGTQSFLAQCSGATVLAKPAEPDVVLQTVSRLLEKPLSISTRSR